MTDNLSSSDESLEAKDPSHSDKNPMLFLLLTLALCSFLLIEYSRMKTLRKDLVQKAFERRGIQFDNHVGRCQLLKEAGLADLKHRLFLLNKAKKPTPGSFKFSRIMGATFARGLDRVAVEVSRSSNNRYNVTIVGSVNVQCYKFAFQGNQQLLPEEQWSQAATVTLKAEFQLKVGEILDWKLISEESWHQPLPEPSEERL